MKEIKDSLLDQKYFKLLRQTIKDQGNLNIQLLASKFGILAGNTYFRNFISGKNTSSLGPKGLFNILDTCEYELKLIPVKKTDTENIEYLNNLTEESFDDILIKVSQLSRESKKTLKVEKKPKKQIVNANLISQALFDDGVIEDDCNIIDDNELVIG